MPPNRCRAELAKMERLWVRSKVNEPTATEWVNAMVRVEQASLWP